MSLVVDQLSLWTVGFKWADLDPNRLWLRIPTPARDNFSTLLEAVQKGHLDCLTLALGKYAGDEPEIARCHIHPWIEDVYAGVFGQSCSRKLLKHAIIERGAFRDWPERCSIPLPEFWFPPGWTDYRWPEEDPPLPQETYSAIKDSVLAIQESTSSTEQVGKHQQYCFVFRGNPVKRELTNSAWHTAIAAAGITDFRFHDLRHTWASWHRKAGTSCDELKELGGWKSREMVDRYAKYGTEHLAVAATRIERVRAKNVGNIVTFLAH